MAGAAGSSEGDGPSPAHGAVAHHTHYTRHANRDSSVAIGNLKNTIMRSNGQSTYDLSFDKLRQRIDALRGRPAPESDAELDQPTWRFVYDIVKQHLTTKRTMSLGAEMELKKYETMILARHRAVLGADELKRRFAHLTWDDAMLPAHPGKYWTAVRPPSKAVVWALGSDPSTWTRAQAAKVVEKVGEQAVPRAWTYAEVVEHAKQVLAETYVDVADDDAAHASLAHELELEETLPDPRDFFSVETSVVVAPEDDDKIFHFVHATLQRRVFVKPAIATIDGVVARALVESGDVLIVDMLNKQQERKNERLAAAPRAEAAAVAAALPTREPSTRIRTAVRTYADDGAPQAGDDDPHDDSSDESHDDGDSGHADSDYEHDDDASSDGGDADRRGGDADGGGGDASAAPDARLRKRKRAPAAGAEGPSPKQVHLEDVALFFPSRRDPNEFTRAVLTVDAAKKQNTLHMQTLRVNQDFGRPAGMALTSFMVDTPAGRVVVRTIPTRGKARMEDVADEYDIAVSTAAQPTKYSWFVQDDEPERAQARLIAVESLTARLGSSSRHSIDAHAWRARFERDVDAYLAERYPDDSGPLRVGDYVYADGRYYVLQDRPAPSAFALPPSAAPLASDAESDAFDDELEEALETRDENFRTTRRGTFVARTDTDGVARWVLHDDMRLTQLPDDATDVPPPIVAMRRTDGATVALRQPPKRRAPAPPRPPRPPKAATDAGAAADGARRKKKAAPLEAKPVVALETLSRLPPCRVAIEDVQRLQPDFYRTYHRYLDVQDKYYDELDAPTRARLPTERKPRRSEHGGVTVYKPTTKGRSHQFPYVLYHAVGGVRKRHGTFEDVATANLMANWLQTQSEAVCQHSNVARAFVEDLMPAAIGAEHSGRRLDAVQLDGDALELRVDGVGVAREWGAHGTQPPPFDDAKLMPLSSSAVFVPVGYSVTAQRSAGGLVHFTNPFALSADARGAPATALREFEAAFVARILKSAPPPVAAAAPVAAPTFDDSLPMPLGLDAGFVVPGPTGGAGATAARPQPGSPARASPTKVPPADNDDLYDLII